MSLIKLRNEDDLFPGMTSFFDDFNDRRFFNRMFERSQMPAVNISEDEKHFEVEVAAPGLKKEDFKINLDGDTLMISAEKKEEHTGKEGKKITKREFSYSSFSRSFIVPENVQADHIEAKYKDGVLSITLPKKDEASRVPPTEIRIN